MSDEIVWMDPEKIKTIEPFDDFLPIDMDTLAAIKDHMMANGYDESQIVTMWKRPKEIGGDEILLDGHARVTAAIDCHIAKIPVFVKYFQTEDEALEHARHLQDARRNITKENLLQLIAELRKRHPVRPVSNDTAKEPQRERERLAKATGKSPATVARAITVLNHADEATKAEVLAGKKSISKAAAETQAARRLIEAPNMPLTDRDDAEPKRAGALPKEKHVHPGYRGVPGDWKNFQRISANIRKEMEELASFKPEIKYLPNAINQLRKIADSVTPTIKRFFDLRDANQL